MAANEAQKSIRFKMTFPAKTLGEPVIHQLSHDHDVVSNIIRGRLTEKSAWPEVDLVGSRKNIDRALAYLSERGIEVQNLDG